jgi:hypothetical protein
MLFSINKIVNRKSHVGVSICVVERRPYLMISTSHGFLNLQATIPSAFRFVMLLLCEAGSARVCTTLFINL